MVGTKTMANIHPTAIVSKKAQLAPDVVIGPYCVVDEDVAIGAGTILEAHVIVYRGVQIGSGNRIFPNSVIGGVPQILGLQSNVKMGRLVIGDRNMIREGVTIHPSKYEGQATTIGNNNLLMIGTHIGHDCVIADNIVLSNLVQIAGHVHIESGAWLAGLAASHQFVTIGGWSFIAGQTGLSRDVPPFLIVSGQHPPKVRGINKRGLRRAGLNEQQQERIHNAYHQLYRQGGTLLANAKSLAAQDGLDGNVRAMVDSIFKSCQHRFGRYREVLRSE
jgi:UDP-N-acetylglucosamine acyltransferase